MLTATASSQEVRNAVSRLMATYFLLHLEVEVKKSDEILLEDYPDMPIREMTNTLIKLTRQEFNISPAEPLPADNMFRRWTELNGKFEYDDSAFPGYNQIYFPRLLDLRDGTKESQELLYSAMRNTFHRFNYEQRGWPVSFFLNSESTMRELMRERVRRNLTEIEEDADSLVLAQSGTYQTEMYEFFEGVLKSALSENVRLLNSILPHQIATELKTKGSVMPVPFKDAAVIFTDFEGFSQATEHREPAEVIRQLDTYFTAFDKVSAKYGLEKIKTIGDSYMAVAGVPQAHKDPVRAACDAALDIKAVAQKISSHAIADGWNIRIGVHAGPLVAGVIGKQKFSYDVWGATVNFASRMESSGAPGQINVSADVHARVEPYYRWEARGPQPVKNLGKAEMYFLLGHR
jgi:class 3 adenylate cyclase